MLKPFEFNEKVALEVILYIANKSQKPTFHHIAKLLYFADKLHLCQYGRFICGDNYIAMKNGPVPSHVYDMLKAVKSGYSCFTNIQLDTAFEVKWNHHVVPLRSADLEWLSDSDIECLDSAIQQYDKFDFGRLTALSHDEAWKSANEDDEISIEAIVKTIGNPSGLLEHLQNPYP